METAAPRKICGLCGQDCANRSRTKDQSGRYFCTECYDRAIERKRLLRAGALTDTGPPPPARVAPPPRVPPAGSPLLVEALPSPPPQMESQPVATAPPPPPPSHVSFQAEEEVEGELAEAPLPASEVAKELPPATIEITLDSAQPREGHDTQRNGSPSTFDGGIEPPYTQSTPEIARDWRTLEPSAFELEEEIGAVDCGIEVEPGRSPELAAPAELAADSEPTIEPEIEDSPEVESQTTPPEAMPQEPEVHAVIEAPPDLPSIAATVNPSAVPPNVAPISVASPTPAVECEEASVARPVLPAAAAPSTEPSSKVTRAQSLPEPWPSALIPLAAQTHAGEGLQVEEFFANEHGERGPGAMLLEDGPPAAAFAGCPRCHRPMPTGAIVCVNCGHNIVTGAVAADDISRPRVRRRPQGSSIGPLLAGGALTAATLGGGYLLFGSHTGLIVFAAAFVVALPAWFLWALIDARDIEGAQLKIWIVPGYIFGYVYTESRSRYLRALTVAVVAIIIMFGVHGYEWNRQEREKERALHRLPQP